MLRVGNFAVGLLALLSSIVTIALSSTRLARNAGSDARLALWIVSTYALVLTLITLEQQLRYGRKARTAESF